MASLTETTMMSPRDAYRRREPPSTLMHWTRLAPELSATSRTVRIWIMTSSLLHELLQQLRHDEALVTAHRRVLGDLHLVADFVFVLLVVGLVARPVLHVLPVERVARIAQDL